MGTPEPRALRDVVFVEGVRTPFGRAGENGLYAETRADDMVVVRDPRAAPPPPDICHSERIDEVAIAAATQIGDQGLTLGRIATILAGLPRSVPGYSIDRMCAGAMTAVTTLAGGIAFGAYDVAIAGGVEHMGHHPMGEGANPNPRFIAEKLVDISALSMGATAENLHDRFPHLTRERADAFAVASQAKLAKAYADGKIQPDLVPVATRSTDAGLGPCQQGRTASTRKHGRDSCRAAHAVPPPRPRHCRERRWPDRRGDGLPARRVRRGRRPGAAQPDAPGGLWLRRRRPRGDGGRPDPFHGEGAAGNRTDH